MKIKLNLKQIEDVRRELEETDRRKFKISEVSQVFRMLQYWSKSVGGKNAKIKSVTELGDGFLCRVNRNFRDQMKEYLKETRSRRFSEEMKERKAKAAVEKYKHILEDTED